MIANFKKNSLQCITSLITVFHTSAHMISFVANGGERGSNEARVTEEESRILTVGGVRGSKGGYCAAKSNNYRNIQLGQEYGGGQLLHGNIQTVPGSPFRCKPDL